MIDCLIVGGGPAGLTAATYLSRFRLDCEVIDGGQSRAAAIPLSRNFPGEPEGIAGAELLRRLRAQIQRYEVPLSKATVTAIESSGATMRAITSASTIEAKTVLLATGKEDTQPHFDDGNHDEAVRRGRLHYCPICDAYEVTGKPIAVLGSGKHGATEALFLARYTRDIKLICPTGDHCMDERDKARAGRAGIELVDGPIAGLRLTSEGIVFKTGSQSRKVTDLYVALGCRQRSELALAAGAELSEDGCIIVDAHQRTSVAGLYAAGDVVVGLDQITTAVGHAAVAATAIRNDLLAGRAK
jgi:thioredoxin reductase (NADPH)